LQKEHCLNISRSFEVLPEYIGPMYNFKDIISII